MYFTRLPDHTDPNFDEALHFKKFKKYNNIFNAVSNNSHCDNHVGCLSIKTVYSGEEWYGIDRRQLAIRAGQFLILNNDQQYSCRIGNSEEVHCLSVFFKQEFASSVLFDALNNEETLLERPFSDNNAMPVFFQTLHDVTPDLQLQLSSLITALENRGYHEAMTDEHLIFLLHYLIRVHRSDLKRADKVSAIKASTRNEIYKRLCIARDILHSSYAEDIDLNLISSLACLSVPQLVRQFKSVFHSTPYQYLIQIRLRHAAHLLQYSRKPVQDVTWTCGFENTSAFSRAFKSAYGIQPLAYRELKK